MWGLLSCQQDDRVLQPCEGAKLQSVCQPYVLSAPAWPLPLAAALAAACYVMLIEWMSSVKAHPG